MLLSNPLLHSIFQDKPMMAYKKLPTLANLLTKNTVQYPLKPPIKQKCYPLVCQKVISRCTHCPSISKEGNIYCTATGKTFNKLKIPSKGYITCKISNIIYCITCKKCKKQYIGQSSREFGRRIYEHKYSISKFPKIDTLVSRHFNQKNHKVSDMKFSVVEWLPEPT